VGEQAFFQIAVALIPLLTFGGLLVTRPRDSDRYWPPPLKDREIFEGAAILLLGLFAIVAETTAIKGAVTGHHSSGDRLIVVTMILVGMVAIVARAFTPRVNRVLKVLAGTKYTRRARLALLGMGVLAIVSVFFSIRGMNDAIRLGEGEARLLRVEQVNTEIAAAYYRLEANGRRRTAVLLRIERLTAKRQPSRADAAALRLLRGEYRAAMRSRRLEWTLIGGLLDEQRDLYEHAIPP
jgi:hypothetical protein